MITFPGARALWGTCQTWDYLPVQGYSKTVRTNGIGVQAISIIFYGPVLASQHLIIVFASSKTGFVRNGALIKWNGQPSVSFLIVEHFTLKLYTRAMVLMLPKASVTFSLWAMWLYIRQNFRKSIWNVFMCFKTGVSLFWALGWK